ncbi:MAG TPA: N-acetyltransferase [Gammaproteobacteria bacterium]|nr:N-acetyltransferase [Gammaproteobacteria bacterium]
MPQLQIHPLESRASSRAFIRLPQHLYRDDPNWICPLYIEQKERFSDKNPFFEHARWRAWIATRDGRPVGRISAQIDELHLQRYRDDTGHFGCLEAEDDPELFRLLFATAEDWLRSQGMRRVTGPFNLSINEECGLLVDGFDTPPRIMMGHARPYYGQAVEQQGYRKAIDLLAYHQPPDFTAPKVMRRLADKVAGRVRLRHLDRSRLEQELELLRDIFNDAWSENWGFVPFTKAEFTEIGKAMTLLIDDDFVQIAEVDGEAAAMLIVLPNINEIIRDLDGRLLPFGWLKLLWRLKVRYPRSARIPLMGVRSKYHFSRLGPALAFLVTEAARQPVLDRGIEDMEMSWILETNSGMRNIIEALGGTAYKTYRLYEKAL